MFTGSTPEALTKPLAVYSNDTTTPKLELTLKAEVVQDVKFDPPFVHFGEVPTDTAASQTLTLTILNPAKVRIESVTANDERFTAKKLKSSADGTATWKIDFSGASIKAPVEAKLILHTKGTAYPQIEVPMRAELVGDVRTPFQIYLSKRNGEYREQSFQIVGREKKIHFKVLEVKDPDDNLRFDVVRESPNSTLVKANAKDPTRVLEKSLEGKIKIRTTSKRDPEMEVGYTLMRQKKTIRK